MMMITITVVIIVIDDRHHQALDRKDGDLVSWILLLIADDFLLRTGTWSS